MREVSLPAQYENHAINIFRQCWEIREPVPRAITSNRTYTFACDCKTRPWSPHLDINGLVKMCTRFGDLLFLRQETISVQESSSAESRSNVFFPVPHHLHLHLQLSVPKRRGEARSAGQLLEVELGMAIWGCVRIPTTSCAPYPCQSPAKRNR